MLLMRTKHHIYDRILMVTLGCAKNIVDSERLMQQFSSNKLIVEFDKKHTKARIVIINTCGFIGDAKKESIDTILYYIAEKRDKKIDNIFIIGCLVERYKNELKKELSEVDGFFGINQMQEIIETLGFKYKSELVGERLISTPSHYAYLKISEGCNRNCSFCAIPSIRGKYESYPMQNIINEASFLAQSGVKELLIIAQDISSYGIDLSESSQLSRLIEKLSKIKGIEWIRLHYAYPKDFPKDLLRVINDNPKVCKYLDIPFQHISDNMLQKMRRGMNKDKTIRLIETIRSAIPEIALRTTLLVGHPGETEKDFEEMVKFLQDTRFDRLGVFKYSHEENTYAAANYTDNVSLATKNKRADIIMSIQKNISMETNKKTIGREYKVIIDRKEDSIFIGRTQFDSPEVDNEVIVKSTKPIKIGNFYTIRIKESSEYDLIGDRV